jgi:hypothetical protein
VSPDPASLLFPDAASLSPACRPVRAPGLHRGRQFARGQRSRPAGAEPRVGTRPANAVGETPAGATATGALPQLLGLQPVKKKLRNFLTIPHVCVIHLPVVQIMNAGAARGDKKFRPHPSLSPGERVAGGRVKGTGQRKGNGASNRSQKSQPRRIRWIKANQAPFKLDQVKSSVGKIGARLARSGVEWGVEWGNVRLCSLMFAYVRLIRKKLLRALRATTGERGKRADFKFLTVRDLISAWAGGGYGNPEGAARGHYWDC